MNHYIYQITNKQNGHYYIGYHYGELDDDYYGSGVSIVKAIKKHGKEHFTKDILAIAPTAQLALEFERGIIGDLWKTHDCYNQTEGGGKPPSWKGRKHSDEAKAKVSAVHKGKKLSDETRAKMSASRKGRIITDEWKANLSAGKKAMWARRRGES